ncbi:MAG: DNA repair protein RadC [Bacilli bacterium]|nr:DNA repair protein RadC [Bacilli bacterium]
MNYRIKDLPSAERPRERLKNMGVFNLTDKEIIAILLKTGTKKQNVEEVAIALLKEYSLDQFSNLRIADFQKIKGIGEVKAIEILASVELGKRIFLRDHKRLIRMENAKMIWESAKYLFTGLKQECFYCYYFNTKQELIEKKLIFMGTINSATTHTREIFKEAYLISASTIVCLHNHPSGDVHPSKADISFTERLIRTGEIQGIPVVDHIIVSEDTYYSFYEHPDVFNL